jgi:hypothetical protein
VLEHLFDPLGCVVAMVDRLAPHAKMVHKVDLRDHGFFTPQGHDLKFLEIPSRLYPQLTRYSGRPNRILFHRYREVLNNLRNKGIISYRLFVTGLAGVGEISPHRDLDDIEQDTLSRSLAFVERHRSRFAHEFHDVSSRDLAVQGFFLMALKLPTNGAALA